MSRYDPALLCGDSVRSATLSPTPLEVGEECMFVGLPRQDAALPVFQQSVVRETCVMEARDASPSPPSHFLSQTLSRHFLNTSRPLLVTSCHQTLSRHFLRAEARHRVRAS